MEQSVYDSETSETKQKSLAIKTSQALSKETYEINFFKTQFIKSAVISRSNAKPCNLLGKTNQ